MTPFDPALATKIASEFLHGDAPLANPTLDQIRSAAEQLRAAGFEIEALQVDRKQLGEVLAKTNDALNRAGCFSALYYWEHIDNIAADRDRLAARVADLRAGKCLGMIPDTFTACGEGGNFCSELCQRMHLPNATSDVRVVTDADTFDRILKEKDALAARVKELEALADEACDVADRAIRHEPMAIDAVQLRLREIRSHWPGRKSEMGDENECNVCRPHDCDCNIVLSPEMVAAQLADLKEHHRRVVDQRNRDWDALMLLIMRAVGTDEDREAADMGEIEEFDPWYALRKHIENGGALLSQNLTACREDLARYRALVAEVEAERDEARACAALEAQHHAFLRKERDEARSKLAEVERERGRIRSLMCASNECRIRGTCAKVDCTSLYTQLDYEAWDTAMHNLGRMIEDRNAALSDLAQVKARLAVVEGERDEARIHLRVCEEHIEALGVMNEQNVRMQPVYEAAVEWRNRKFPGMRSRSGGVDGFDGPLVSAIDHALSTSQPAKEMK